MVHVAEVGVGEPRLAEDTCIGDFRVRGLLGEGAMGEVYLAQDVTLGRRVALKLIKRSAMRADGLARFLEEARTTATFNHPHIVVLHAVGEHDGRPYLALEYLDGESLRARLAAGPLAPTEALRCCRAVADAVAEAHRRGVVHADLKPENIVIPRDGRVRVVDFGLAKLADAAGEGASGTPAYMAPERWRGAAPSGAFDVWAIGVTLHELVTGRRPFADAALPRLAFAAALPALELPAAPWAEVVRACLAADPAARPTADELVQRLGALLEPRPAAPADERCPFPGLAAFSSDDAAAYTGRAAELDAIVEQLRTRPLIPVIGPSGIGKSSFVRAAVIPRVAETAQWTVAAVRPGGAPFERLAAALAGAGAGSPGELAGALRRHTEGLSLILAERARARGGRLLVFLDQFEEVFTLGDGDADAIAFCDALARAAVPDEPWRIVLTLRDDFLGRLAAAPAMRGHLGAVMMLPPLAAADLHAAIARPLASAGYTADAAALIPRIVRDVDGQPARLPLLQFACRALWERRDLAARQILTSEYEKFGGATGALAALASRFVDELPSAEVRIVRSILLALVHPDGTRRPRLRADLLDGLPPEQRATADRLVERLLERRLLAAARDAERDATLLELAHEALATAWKPLAGWLDESYQQRLLIADLERASDTWERNGQRDDETWGEALLADAERKLAAWSAVLSPRARAFLEAGVHRARRLRRRRRWLVGSIVGALAAGTIIAALAALAFARNEERLRASQDEMRLAAADIGALRLELVPFDWSARDQRATAPAHPPALAWTLRAVGATDSRAAGRPFSDADVRRGTPAWIDGALVEDVEARSGPAFLEIARGDCAPSLIYLRRLPGYTERDRPARLRIPVPTCAASREDTVEIPAGPYLRSHYDEHDRGPVDVEQVVPAYRIDRTEVTRAAFEIYGALAALTDDRAAPSGYLAVAAADAPRVPVVGVTFFTARAYCRFLGKELPTLDEWQKAFRGGLALGGAPNPDPRRRTPWLDAHTPVPANLDPGDGRSEIARVDRFPDDESPYGVRGLAGNVSEWSETIADTPRVRGLRWVLGGNWGSPVGAGQHQITWRNTRYDLSIDFGIGLRCVARAAESQPVQEFHPSSDRVGPR